MENMVKILIIVAIVSFILGFISRIMLKPFLFSLEAGAFLEFSQLCFLAAATFLLYKMAFRNNT